MRGLRGKLSRPDRQLGDFLTWAVLNATNTRKNDALVMYAPQTFAEIAMAAGAGAPGNMSAGCS